MVGVGIGTFSQMGILSLKGWVGVSLLLTTVPIMYRYTVPVVNREPVDYPAFWCNVLEGSSQAHLQHAITHKPYCVGLVPLPSTLWPHCLAQDRLWLWCPASLWSGNIGEIEVSETDLKRILDVIGPKGIETHTEQVC